MLFRSQCRLQSDSLAFRLYQKDVITERHRHRYEFNNNYLDRYRAAGLGFSGMSRDDLVEIVELADHPWFVATQFHPEFTSNPRDGHPLFSGFIAAARAHHLGVKRWNSPASKSVLAHHFF